VSNRLLDHLFAIFPTVGYRFAPRIRDLKEKKLYVPDDPKHYPTLKNFLGDKPINTRIVRPQWDE